MSPPYTWASNLTASTFHYAKIESFKEGAFSLAERSLSLSCRTWFWSFRHVSLNFLPGWQHLDGALMDTMWNHNDTLLNHNDHWHYWTMTRSWSKSSRATFVRWLGWGMSWVRALVLYDFKHALSGCHEAASFVYFHSLYPTNLPFRLWCYNCSNYREVKDWSSFEKFEVWMKACPIHLG